MKATPLTEETKAAIRKMIREELRSIEDDKELEKRVSAAAMEELEYGHEDLDGSSPEKTKE